jgi:hypothetical protein
MRTWLVALCLAGLGAAPARAEERSSIGRVHRQPDFVRFSGMSFRVPPRLRVTWLHETQRGLSMEYRDEATQCQGEAVWRTTFDDAKHEALVRGALERFEARAREAGGTVTRSSGSAEIFGHAAQQTHLVVSGPTRLHAAVVDHRLPSRSLSLLGSAGCDKPEQVKEVLDQVIAMFESRAYASWQEPAPWYAWPRQVPARRHEDELRIERERQALQQARERAAQGRERPDPPRTRRTTPANEVPRR